MPLPVSASVLNEVSPFAGVSPPRKPSSESRSKHHELGDVELRSTLDPYIKDDYLAQLGWQLIDKDRIYAFLDDMVRTRKGEPTPYTTSGEMDLQGRFPEERGYWGHYEDIENPTKGQIKRYQNIRNLLKKYQGVDEDTRKKRNLTVGHFMPEKLSKPYVTYGSESYLPPHYRNPEALFTLTHELRHVGSKYLDLVYNEELGKGGEEGLQRALDYIQRKKFSPSRWEKWKEVLNLSKDNPVINKLPSYEVEKRHHLEKYGRYKSVDTEAEEMRGLKSLAGETSLGLKSDSWKLIAKKVEKIQSLAKQAIEREKDRSRIGLPITDPTERYKPTGVWRER